MTGSATMARQAPRPGSFARRAVRELREVAHFSALPWFRPREVVWRSLSSKVIAETLRSQGICKLEGLLCGERLRTYQQAFDGMMRDAEREGTATTDTPGASAARVDLRRYPLFADLVLDELVLAAVEDYYRRPVYLSVANAQRMEPVEPYAPERSFLWHHDAKGKYVKAMWLLTDVPSTGQRMSYILGTNRAKRRAQTYEESRFTDEQVQGLGDVFECAAPAGSVFLFDTNAIHRGNRNQGPRRDVVFSVYSAGRYLHGCQFDPGSVRHLAGWQQRVLERSRTPSPQYASEARTEI